MSVAVIVCVLPGWLWTRVLWTDGPDEGWTERVGLSTGLSLALVPVAALALARLLGTGVTTGVAALSVLIVAVAGLGAFVVFGAASSKKDEQSAPPPPSGLGASPLLAVSLAFAVVVVSNVVFFRDFWTSTVECWGWGGVPCTAAGSAQRLVPLVALALVVAGALYLYGQRNVSMPPEDTAGVRNAGAPSGWRRFLLPVVLLATVVRNYSGVVLHDWPFIRGVDHYSHAVMANRMMFEGRIEPYLIYPSGFHLAVADISRLSGLDPLEIFPVVGPLLPVLPVIACYTLAKRIWSWQVGVGTAFLVGLVTSGPYYYLTDSMYPNLIGAQFLLVLTVAAIVGLYSTPSPRSVALVALLGSSIVLFHQVSSLYLALLLAALTLYVLPYLLVTSRRTGVALLTSFALLSLISFFYAWDIYDLPRTIASSLGLAESGATRDAVSSAIGTQNPFSLGSLIGGLVSQPVWWLALFGAILATGTFAGKRLVTATGSDETLPKRLALLTVLLWSLLMVAGSATSLSGFPQRFGRDMGIPLSLFAAFALVALLGSLARQMPGGRVPLKRSLLFYAAAASVLLVGTVTGIKAAQGVYQAATPSWRMVTTPQIAAAGEWLEAHNTGGNIIVGPQRNQVPSRMMLAMGDYSALQSFTRANISANRDLPPTGAGPLEDVFEIMYDPSSGSTARLLEKYDVRYVVHFKDMPDRGVVPYWWAFDEYPGLYKTVFENSDAVIYAPRKSFADTGQA